MIKKILKYMSVFSLWLAGLVLSVHLIIPHDHHIVDSFSDQDKKCPASDKKPGHGSGFPLHCHAFNDIASERLRTFHIVQNIKSVFISFSNFSDLSLFKVQDSCINITDFQKPIFDSYALELSFLRAPPALA